MTTQPDRYTKGSGNIGRHKGKRIGTLWTSDTRGEGDVTMSPYFDALPPLQRLDVLRDVLGLLQREHDLLNADVFRRTPKEPQP